MENKSTATATDITAVDNEAVQNVNDYIRALAQSDLTGASTAAQEMNDTFTRRQMMIGTSIDFAALKRDLQSQMNDLALQSHWLRDYGGKRRFLRLHGWVRERF